MEHPLSGARWVGAAGESPVVIRRFCAGPVEKATLFVTGLGFFEARINGQPVTAERFLPPVTDYEPRDLSKFLYPLRDRTRNSIQYCEFDVTALLRPGENTLTIQLGGGFYRQTERTAEGQTTFGDTLKTIYSLKLGEVSIDSDGSEVFRPSGIVFSRLFIGEVIDPAAEAAPEGPVTVLPDPASALVPRVGPGDVCARTIRPVYLGKGIFDAGENISGLVRLRTHGPRGHRIRLRFAENLTEAGEPDFRSTGADYTCASGRKQIMEDIFICDGTERWFEPKFVWHAFRYVQAEGEFDELQVLVIHADCPVTATFDSSSEGLNYLYEAFLRTQRNNMHGGVPSDCPHRERLGYTGDGQVCAEAAMLLLHSREFYRKWIGDILDCQDPDTGHVQHTAPLMGGGGGPGGWGCAMVLVPWAFYRQYGEREMLARCWEPMKKWAAYLQAHTENGLVVREEPGGWCLGDWCTPEEPVELPEPLVNSCYFVWILNILEEIAGILGKEYPYCALRDRVSGAIRERWLAQGHFAGGVQGADAFALRAGLGGAELAAALAKKYDALGHFDTGFLGTDILVEVLCRYGYIDTVLKLLESEEPGSFLWQKRRGATTLWETWTGSGSQDHPMFGACVRQLFTAFLGIRWDGTLTIAPRIPRGLQWARGSLLLPPGRVSVEWEQRLGHLRFRIGIPPALEARFVYGDRELRLTGGERELILPKSLQLDPLLLERDSLK